MPKAKYDYQKYREYQKEYQRTSPAAKAAKRRYYLRNKFKWKIYDDKARHGREGTLKTLFRSIKNKARLDLLDFDLTLEWMLQCPEVCPILDIPILFGEGRGSHHSPSVYREHPELGYTQKNCSIISNRANTLKRFGTLDEYQKICSSNVRFILNGD